MHSPPLTNRVTSDSVTVFSEADQLIPPLSDPAVAPVPPPWTTASANLTGEATAGTAVAVTSAAEMPRIVPSRAKRRIVGVLPVRVWSRWKRVHPAAG